jgi:hypothetical protein
MPEKQYLGDGVYVSFDGFHIILTTWDGYRDTNTIYLEDTVFIALQKYVEKCYNQPAEENIVLEPKEDFPF